MAKNKFANFSALAALQTPPVQVADLETPEETIQESSINTVDPQGEDLGDVDTAAPAAADSEDEVDPLEESVEDEQTTADDERVNEESNPGLNDEVEEEESVVETPAPTLNDRPVATWTTEELEAYITGQVDITIYHSIVEQAITEHRIREVALAQAWTIDECKEFLAQGIVPAKTSKGAWLKDVTRQYRREHEWTTQELESWALGEISPEGVTLAAGLAIELKQRLNLTVPSVDIDAVITCYKHNSGQVIAPVVYTKAATAVTPPVTEARVAEVKAQLRYEGLSEMNQSYIESSLATFHEVMRPGKAISKATGGDAQKLLKEVITYAISLPDPAASNAAMLYLYNHFKENRAPGKIFEDTYAFRCIEDMRATTKEQENHALVLTLFLAYADPMVELREQTDVASLIRGVPTHLQSRLLEFFSKV